MKEWRSRLEELTPAEELRFPPTQGFRPFQRYFAKESVAHPAKANCYLLYYLIKKYTKPNETVLDPMAGTSSTGIIASLLERHSICVELEPKFVEWSRKNVECLEKSGKKRGEIKIVQGDARRLTQLLGVESDVAITSPPYSETYTGGGDPEKRRRRLIKAGHNPKDFLGGKARNAVLKHYNEADTVITSPPYSESIHTCQQLHFPKL